MSDDKKKRGPADRTRINVNESYELAYWTKKLGVLEKTLRDALDNVVTPRGTVVFDMPKNIERDHAGLVRRIREEG